MHLTRSNMAFFGIKGQVTKVRSGRNSNTSEILCLCRLSASLIKIQLKQNRLCSGQGQIRCFCGTEGQVTPKWIVSSEILWLSWLSASLKMTWLKVKALSSGQHLLSPLQVYGKIFCCSRASNRVTPKWMVPSGPKSNSSGILCLSSLPASMTKIQSKMNLQSSR